MKRRGREKSKLLATLSLVGGGIIGSTGAFAQPPPPPDDSWCHMNGWSHTDTDGGNCNTCFGTFQGPICSDPEEEAYGNKSCITRSFTYNGVFHNRECHAWGDECYGS